jgi:excisionase family DNA binding protein
MLPKRFTVAAAAELLSVSVATVLREIAAGRLACYRLGPKGKKIQVGEHHLGEYLSCREAKRSESVNTSSASAATASIGAPAGSTHVLDKPSAVASAQATFGLPKSRWPGSSPITATSGTPSPSG